MTDVPQDLQILVVVGLLADEVGRDEDRAARQLVLSLHEQCRDSAITVLSIDPRTPRSAVAAFGERGVRVIAADDDWVGALRDARFGFSHVFLADSALGSWAQRHVDQWQPQATKVAYLSSLPFREVAGLGPVVAPDERDGLAWVRGHVEEWLLADLGGVSAIWCEQRPDADFLASLPADRPVSVIPPVVEGRDPPHPLTGRRGVVVMATAGHDVLSGNEEAALVAITEVLPALKRRGVGELCTVVTDWPSPQLDLEAARHGVTVVGSDHLEHTLAGARVALVTHSYGVGGRAAIYQALGAGTPFVATVPAAAGCDLGGLERFAVRGPLPDVVAAARPLLVDDHRWNEFAQAAEAVRDGCYGRGVREGAVRSALPALGIVPRRPSRLAAHPPALGLVRRARRAVGVALRPPCTPTPPPMAAVEPTDPVARYELWAARSGPSPAVLDALAAELANLELQPTISILMPVYNTDPDILIAAIDSVRAQLYPHWQLCVADDGSDRQATLDVLHALRTDPRVAVTRLGGNSGISAATNAALALAEGDWVTFLDHDDLLKPHALAQIVRWINADPELEVIYSDEDKLDDEGRLVQPHLKPDWAPDQLMSHNYVCHLTVARRALVEEVGGLRSEFDGSQDYDLILRLGERTDRIAHIPEPLYTWRMVAGSTAVLTEEKPYALIAGRQALDAALARRGLEGQAETTTLGGIYRTRYRITGDPRVAIIIPTKDRVDLLRPCIESVMERSTYANYEIIVIDNESSDGETLEYLAHLPGRVLRYPFAFNYARMINFGARAAAADILLFLNNDTQVISPDWIEAMLEHAVRPEVGAVGARLYFGDGRPQHEGILVGVMGLANSIDYGGFWVRGDVVRNVSAVTGACTMMRRSVFRAVGGNDERLAVAYNDVDLCLRVRQAGLQVVYTPYARLYHHESSTRRGDDHHDGPFFERRWRPNAHVDPYYSPLLDPDRLFQIKL